MAVTYTVSGVNSSGNLKSVHGTFTSAIGDTDLTLNPTVHGLNYIADYSISLDTGGINSQSPKCTVSGGTITATVDDTLGYSGKFFVLGR